MSIVSINFKLRTEEKSSLQQFETVREGVRFVKSLDMSNVEYVSLTDGYGNQVLGQEKIQKVYHRNDDMYAGQKYCIHMYADSNPSGGGGTLCPDCKAWFCY